MIWWATAWWALAAEPVSTEGLEERIGALLNTRTSVVVGVQSIYAESALKQITGRHVTWSLPVVRVPLDRDPTERVRSAVVKRQAACGLVVTGVAGQLYLDTVGACPSTPPAPPVTAAPPPAPPPGDPVPPVPAPPVASAPTPTPTPASVGPSDYADMLTELPDHAARTARVTDDLATATPEQAAKLGQTLAVLRALETHDRADHTVVRWFLRAVLSDDPALRAQAVEAARAGGDPPVAGLVEAAPPPDATVAPPAAPSGNPELELDFQDRKLSVKDVTLIGAANGNLFVSPSWSVVQGSNQILGLRKFATTVGDRPMLDKLRQRDNLMVAGVGLSAAALVAGLVVIAKDDLGTADMVVGLTLMLGGTAAGTFSPVYTATRRSVIAPFYTRADARRLSAQYNTNLRKRMGLPPQP